MDAYQTLRNTYVVLEGPNNDKEAYKSSKSVTRKHDQAQTNI